ncbi:hypothetical protein NXK88_002545 [Enterococcus hirae]|uniref:hypothetical protein n=1 Tax=Enterococcus hirae TaxID=1354 RepID=UPI0020730829|nr:hypothetical protein [Enterococcus hirae]EMF0203294.1 hypothetical protein [Enterococcus hirae]
MMMIRFKEVDNMSLLTDKKIALDKAFIQLKRENEELLARAEIGWCTLEIYAENQEIPVFEGSYDFPIEDFHLISLIEQSLTENGQLSEEAQAFIQTLNSELPKFYQLKKDQKKERRPIKSKKKEKPFSSIETTSIQTNCSIQKKKISFQWLLFGFIVVVSCGLFIMQLSTNRQLRQLTQKEHQLQERVEMAEEITTKQPQIDTFSRYFITNFYSGEMEEERYMKKLQSFLTKKVAKQISPQKEKVRSILSWEMKKKANHWQIAYIVTLETEKKTQETKKVSFQLEEQGKNYLVSTLPELDDFEINQ